MVRWQAIPTGKVFGLDRQFSLGLPSPELPIDSAPFIAWCFAGLALHHATMNLDTSNPEVLVRDVF